MGKVKPARIPKTESDYRPSREISFDSDELPQVKNWDVDGKYVLHLHVTQVSKSKGESFYSSSEANSKKISARFKVTSVTADEAQPAKKSSTPIDAVKNKYGGKRRSRSNG